MTPTIDADGIPDTCLSVEVRSDWGHFKKYGRTATKQTFDIIPRTTAAGLLAAIVGAPRDSYYDTFGKGRSAIAITPLTEIRSINVPTTGVGTDPDAATAQTAGSSRSRSITYQDTTQHRQIHNYEVLVDPAYRIDIAVEDETFYTELREHLEAGTSTYPPSMGLSEYLASVDYLGEYQPEHISEAESVDSVVPIPLADTIPQPGVAYRIERSPAIMEQYDGGRRTTRFDDIVYTPHSDDTIRFESEDIHTASVDGSTVVFR
jgi:CRISPR-associated protein Cas5h